MLRIRPTGAGILFIIFPLLLLYRGFSQTDTASLIAGMGLFSLVLLSFIFLLSGIPRVLKMARSADQCSRILPEMAEIGRERILKVNPERSGFLPGIRLSVQWSLSFGPFRYSCAAPLPVKGAASARLIPPRRGEWLVRCFLRAADPYGFFHFDYKCGSETRLFVPPRFRSSDVADFTGRPAAEAASAPRLKEDAEERLERRAYIPGDDPRRLDWKVFARTGEMHVRVGEETIPDRGRIWLQLVSPDSGRFGKRFREKAGIRRFDTALEAMAALVCRLENDGLEVRALLPGEEGWRGTETGWEKRLARCLPVDKAAVIHENHPSPGEFLRVIAHPVNYGGLSTAARAAAFGCRVSIAYPSAVFLSGSSWMGIKNYRRYLKQAEAAAEREGFDVRRI